MPIHEAITMVIVIAIISFGGFLTIDSVLSHRRKMAQIKFDQSGANSSASENAELRETVEHLQDRLAVLETIATDPARRTADEIEDLRHAE